jgi:hypothetical protein
MNGGLAECRLRERVKLYRSQQQAFRPLMKMAPLPT